jgi:hypothetical protein
MALCCLLHLSSPHPTQDGITICVVGANTGAGLKSLSATSTDKMQIVQQHFSKVRDLGPHPICRAVHL